MVAQMLCSTVVILILIFGINVRALTALSNCSPGRLQRGLDPLIQVLEIGPDNRHIVAPNEGAKVAATGRMKCPTGTSTIQVVNSGSGPSSVVVTSSHQFYGESCNEFIGISGCTITFPHSRDGRPYTINKNTFKHGGCPTDGDSRKDWAVFELDRPVVGVEPYDVRAENATKVLEGTEVLTISAQSKDLAVNGVRPFHTSPCIFKHRFLNRFVPLQSDCHLGLGSSGAGQYVFDQGPRPILVAVHVADHSKDNQYPPGLEYHSRDYYNISVPLEGEFLRAVHQTLRERRSR